MKARKSKTILKLQRGIDKAFQKEMKASDKRQCSSCGKLLDIKDKHNRYFGTLKLPIKGTGKDVNLGVHKLGAMEFNVVDWTGLEQPSEMWECGTGWCYWSREIRYGWNELIEKLTH